MKQQLPVIQLNSMQYEAFWPLRLPRLFMGCADNMITDTCQPIRIFNISIFPSTIQDIAFFFYFAHSAKISCNSNCVFLLLHKMQSLLAQESHQTLAIIRDMRLVNRSDLSYAMVKTEWTNKV